MTGHAEFYFSVTLNIFGSMGTLQDCRIWADEQPEEILGTPQKCNLSLWYILSW